MVLEALELSSRTSKQETGLDSDALTVEHVLPQGWEQESWPLPALEGDDIEGLRLKRNTLLQTLGNLTLLTQPLNSTVSRGPFKEKRGAIALQSRLVLNSYFQRFQDTDPWDERQIVARGQELAKVGVRIWKRPNT